MTPNESSDQQWMQRCLDLARQALGRTAPNPMVGSVVVQEGQVVGEGFHPQAGQPHAEVFALRSAGALAAGATLYVNLEPCNHYGRTPPCTEAIVAAGVRRVVIGMIDPDPRVSGRGVARLQQAGIEVTIGVAEAACRQLNEAFIHRVLHHQPLGIWKYAMTLDGKIATTTGHSAWITSPAARAEVHTLRAACQAVIVGGSTVRLDNPRLTSHGVSSHNPLRVVMSRSLNLPPIAHLWQVDQAKTLVCTTAEAPAERRSQLEQQGVEVVCFDCLTPAAVMRLLADRGACQVLWECGGILAAAAISDRSIHKIWAFIAPKLIGGQLAPSPLGDLGLTQMTDALSITAVQWRTIGPDMLLEGYLET